MTTAYTLELTEAQARVLIEVAHFADDKNINKTKIANSISVDAKTVRNAINKFKKVFKND